MFLVIKYKHIGWRKDESYLYPTFHNIVIFPHSIITLREAGILNHLLSAAHLNATECVKPFTLTLGTPKERPLELLDFYGVFSLYVAGETVLPPSHAVNVY